MVVIDVCDSKSQSMIFFSMDLRISHVERFKIFFSFSTLEITLKSTELIHAFTIVGIIPLV